MTKPFSTLERCICHKAMLKLIDELLNSVYSALYKCFDQIGLDKIRTD